MRDLPRDVLIHILIRLPAKSLGQFKSVCKYWFSLISSADFVKLHHRLAILDIDHSRVLIESTYSLHSVSFTSLSCYYEGFDDDDANAIVSLNYPFEKESVVSKLRGSCYGLIYFVCYNECVSSFGTQLLTERD